MLGQALAQVRPRRDAGDAHLAHIPLDRERGRTETTIQNRPDLGAAKRRPLQLLVGPPRLITLWRCEGDERIQLLEYFFDRR